MKYIVRILVSAFAFISAAACYNNEIENPDNPQNPEQSGLRITATMAKTRVSFGNEDSNNIYPEWEEGDILFGFYVDGSKVIQNFILKVVDTSNSTATLDFVKGNENGLADQPRETKVYLIYTGKNGDSSIADTDIFSSTGEFSVDLTSQNLDRIPVCMSASAEIEDGSDGEKTLSFGFTYDCAVLEIQSLRGFKEDKSATSISKIEVTDLVLGGKYTYDTDDGLNFEANTATETYSVEDLAKWGVNADGKLVYEGNPKGFLIAAAPNSTSKEIKVKVYNSASSETPYFVHPCNSTTISAGRCYVVRSEEVVAKTIDDLYFTTVKAAFDHARELSEDNSGNYNTAETNVVTLLAPEIDGLGTPTTGWWNGEYDVALMIDIDYPVTLDLNGCVLDLQYAEDEDGNRMQGDSATSGAFNVKSSGSFTVKDSSGGDGYLESCSSCDLIINNGTTIIDSGNLWCYFAGGIINTQSLSVYGGEVFSKVSYAIKSVGGSITIDQPDEGVETLIDSSSETSPAIYVTADGSNTASFTMKGGTVTGYGFYSGSEDICGAIELEGNVVGSISSGSIQTSNNKSENTDYAGYALFVHDGSKCTISGGEVISISSFLPSVFCYTSSTTDDGTSLTVSGGTITGYSGGVTLEGKVTGTFTGGEVDTIYGGSAVLVNNGSVCTISGGKYYKAAKNSQDPTIRAFGRQNAGTKLTIKWPDVSQTGGETKPEPLIYVSDPSRACVGADLYGNEESYATVELLGGYYYIDYFNAIKHNKTFFTRSVSAPIVQFGYVYTNQTGLKDGSYTHTLDATSSSFTVNGKLIKAVEESPAISVSCQLEGNTKTIQFAYRVAPEEQ